MGERRTQAERRASTQAQLLDAAERVFTARGFHGASLDEVAEEAGRSKGSVYAHFDSKDDLFLAVLERRVDSRMLDIEEGIAADRPMAEQTSAAGAAFFDVLLGQADWSLLLMEYSAHAARDPELSARFSRRNERIREAMSAQIEEHLSALGLEAPVSSADLAVILFALGNGMLLQKLIDPATVPDTLFGDALMMVLGGLRPRQPG